MKGVQFLMPFSCDCDRVPGRKQRQVYVHFAFYLLV